MRRLAISMLIVFALMWQGLWFVRRIIQRAPTSETDTYLILSAIWLSAWFVFLALRERRDS